MDMIRKHSKYSSQGLMTEAQNKKTGLTMSR
jgi:hypothetical protein